MQPRTPAPIPPNAPQTGWQITGQVRQVGDPGTGTLVDGYKVSFRTGGGTNSWVFVPFAMYSPQNVAAAVAAHAAQLDQVSQLTG